MPMMVLTYQMSYPQLLKRFREAVFGKKVFCPHCGYKKPRKISSTKYWCKKCRKRFSLTSCTIFKGSKLPLEKLILLLECFLKGFKVKQTQELIGVSRKAVSHWFQKFRENVPEIEREEFFESDIFVLDDSYFGGKRKENKGRKTPFKTIVLGLLNKSFGKVKVCCVPSLHFKIVASFLNFYLPSKKVKLFSDSFKSYQLAKKWLKLENHTLIDHQKRFKETNPVENVWSVMKRKLREIYHHATRKYMPFYVKELAYRFNTRNNPDDAFSFLRKVSRNQWKLSKIPVPFW